MLDEYQHQTTKAKFQCKCGNIWEARPGNILQGINCPHCDGQFPLNKEVVNKRIADKGIVMIDDYINNSTKRRFRCEHGHNWQAVPAKVLVGYGCPECAGKLPLTKDRAMMISGV